MKTTNSNRAFALFIIFKVFSLISFFVCGFVMVSSYIPFDIKFLVTVIGMVVGLGSAIISHNQEMKYKNW